MKLTIYSYNRCSTCRKAVKWLQERGHELEEIPLFEQPPTETELTELIRKSELGWKKFFNTSGQVYREMGLKDKLSSMSEQEIIALLASNGRLIKRPIVTDGNKVTVGFNEAVYEENWQ